MTGDPSTDSTDIGSGVGREELGRIRLFILLALAAGATYLIGLVLRPFLPAIVLSGVLAVLIHPAYRPFEEWVGQKDVAAFFATTVAFFLIVLPLAALSVIVVEQIRAGFGWATNEAAALVEPGSMLRGWVDRIVGILGLNGQGLSETVRGQMQSLASALAGRTLRFLSGLGGWLLQAGAALFTLFYLLRDGHRLVETLKWLIPMDAGRSDALVARAREVTYATMYGTVVVAAVQGTLGGLVFWILDLEGAALWGTVMGVLSLLPAVGPPVVYIPAVVILFATGHVAKGIILLVIGALVISTIDNLLRAILVSEKGHLHSLVVFFSVLGGLFVFGAAGIVVGPVLFVLALTIIEMARLALEPGQEALVPEEAGRLLVPDETRRRGREEEG